MGLTERLRVAEFWEKGFDKKTSKSSEFPTLRSYMLAQSVEELNVILQEYNNIIGVSTAMRISFNTELELNEDFGKVCTCACVRVCVRIRVSLICTYANTHLYTEICGAAKAKRHCNHACAV